MRERIIDLVFLIGVVFKGIDGLLEVIGGILLLFVTRGQLLSATNALTDQELSEDPHDLMANLLIHGVSHLHAGGELFIAAYLVIHGVVKLAIVIALLIGPRRVYPWAMGALGVFVLFQLYELVISPSPGVAILTILDVVIIWLTWREWRGNRELRTTWRGTINWIFRRPVTS